MSQGLMKVKQEELVPLRPFMSVFIIVSSLFIVVFAKMEERRMGYNVLKFTHSQRVSIEEKRARILQLAKLTRPEHVEKVAQDRFTLKKIQNKQIIQLSGNSSVNAGLINPVVSEISAKEF